MSNTPLTHPFYHPSAVRFGLRPLGTLQATPSTSTSRATTSTHPPATSALKGDLKPVRCVLKADNPEGVTYLGQCEQTTMPDCYLAAFLNGLTIHPQKARLLQQAVRQVGPDRYEVTLASKWDRHPTPVSVDVQEMRQAYLNEAIAGVDGPLTARLFEFAIAKHLQEPLTPAVIKRLKVLDFHQTAWIRLAEDLARRKNPTTAALDNCQMSCRLLTGHGFDDPHTVQPSITSRFLDEQAPEFDRRVLIFSEATDGTFIRHADGQHTRLFAQHGYTVVDISPEKKQVVLLNPHQGSKPFATPYDEVEKCFGRLNIAKLPL